MAQSQPEGRSVSTLVTTLVEQLSTDIWTGRYRAGEKLLSVRVLAKQKRVSCFTAAEVYERLVATGLAFSRRGKGYFVARQFQAAGPPPAGSEHADGTLQPDSDGETLPRDWLSEKLLVAIGKNLFSAEQASDMPVQRDILGMRALRFSLSQRLGHAGISVPPDQMALVASDIQAVDLALRVLVSRGDAVMVEDPCAPYMLPLIRQHGCKVVSVKRDGEGLDIPSMRALAAATRPRLAIITTVFQNPLGSSLSHSQVHQILGIANEHDFLILEEDASRHLAHLGDPSLTAMDGLRRVIRLGSSSKILPPFAQISSLSASTEIIEKLRGLMKVIGLNNSELHQRVLLNAFLSSHFRRHIAQLRSRLEVESLRALNFLAEMGLEPLARPSGGIYVSARVRNPTHTLDEIVRLARERKIALSPANQFTASQPDDVWFRFTVASVCQPAVRSLLAEISRPAEMR